MSDAEDAVETLRSVLRSISSQPTPQAEIGWAVLASLGDRSRDASRCFPLLQTVRLRRSELRERLRERGARRHLSAGELDRGLVALAQSRIAVSLQDIDRGTGNGPKRRTVTSDRLFDIASDGRGWLVRGGQWAFWAIGERERVLLCRLASLLLLAPPDIGPAAVEFALRLAYPHEAGGGGAAPELGPAERRRRIRLLLREAGILGPDEDG